MSATSYRKKPVVIEAMLLNDESRAEVVAWCGAIPDLNGGTGPILINTLEGMMMGMPGDYIIKGVKGEFYPCKPEIFAATYEPVATVLDPTIGLEEVQHGESTQTEVEES